MSLLRCSVALCTVLAGVPCFAQAGNHIELPVTTANRTLSVSADEQVTAEPDVAIVHIGFVTPPSDAKQAYAAGSRASNEIVDALKKAGIPESSIRSEWQGLQSTDEKARKYQLHQSWAVEVPPARVAEVLDEAVSAGATDSGNIEWTVKDEHALEDRALQKAAARATSDAAVLARGMGVHLGALLYTTNELSGGPVPVVYGAPRFNSMASQSREAAPLAIEPHKVSRSATVYAVYSIE